MRNLTILVAFYSKFATFSDFKKFKIFFRKTHLFFLKKTQILNVLRNLTISVACILREIFQKKPQKRKAQIGKIAQGCVSHPHIISTYAFASCTSGDVYRIFSVLIALIVVRPNLLDITLKNMVFIHYKEGFVFISQKECQTKVLHSMPKDQFSEQNRTIKCQRELFSFVVYTHSF